MYFTMYLASLIDNTHKAIAAQETVWEHNTIQGNQMLESGIQSETRWELTRS